ncbi:lipopolysaccharide kinase InaA family protein [Escherichia coli]|uniref:lipopolysaccharide kinase InaA family protein n=1 Tax=Escherichia coli TaxID=562 RepID=UPI003F4EA3F4
MIVISATFLLHLPFSGREEELNISVIDLHRAQIRAKVPRRWRDKDLDRVYISHR